QGNFQSVKSRDWQIRILTGLNALHFAGRGWSEPAWKKATLRKPRGGWVIYSTYLLNIDHAEYTVSVVLRARGVEELVGGTVVGGAAAKLDSPELVNLYGLVGSGFHRPNEGAGRRVIAIDRARVDVVADQQGVAERAEVRGSHGKSPGLIEGFPLSQSLDERPGFSKDVNVPTLGAALRREGDIELAVNVLNAKGDIAPWSVRVGERHDEVEVVVVNVDFVIPPIGGIEKVAGSVTGNRQAGVDSTRTRVIHCEQCIVGIVGRPAADRTVKRVENERRRPTVDLEFRRTVVDDARGRARAAAGSGWNRDLQTLLHARAGVERRKAGALIAEPEGFAGGIGKSPGIDELLIAFLAGIFHQRGRRVLR